MQKMYAIIMMCVFSGMYCGTARGGHGGPAIESGDTQELRRAKQAMEDANRAWNTAKIAETNVYMKMNESNGANIADQNDYMKKKALREQKEEAYELAKSNYIAVYNDVYGNNPTIVPIPVPTAAPVKNNAPVQQPQQQAQGSSLPTFGQVVDGVNAAANIIHALNGASASQSTSHVVVVTVPSSVVAQALAQQQAAQQALNRMGQDIDEAAARRKKLFADHESACAIIREQGGAQLIKETGCSHGALYTRYAALSTTLSNKSWDLSSESNRVSAQANDHYWRSW